MWFSSLFLLSSSSVALAGIVATVNPLITPAPTIENIDLRQRQDDMNLASLAEVLLTGVPKSILALALTNVPAVSRLLWSEFLDDNTPTWFIALPTDVQAYLSGEFGPTTAASKSASTAASSSVATTTSATPAPSVTAVADTSNNHDGGLPLWVKILIGVLVPLFVLGLIALLLLCCLRRRRRHRQASDARSRTSTPAFVSTTYRTGPANPPGEQHVPLRAGYISRDAEPDHEYLGSSHHRNSSSEEYRTPMGGPSYENIPPPATTNRNNPHRSSKHSSRHSSSSLRSVPEVPEPMHNPRNDSPSMPLLPRSPHRSRDFSQPRDFGGSHLPKDSYSISPLQPSYSNNHNGSAQASPHYIQGIYAGGYHPYPNAHHASNGDRRPFFDPFSDPFPPRQSSHAHNSGHIGVAGRDPELFIDNHGVQQGYEGNWPLQASEEGGYRTPGRTKSYDRYYEKQKVYET